MKYRNIYVCVHLRGSLGGIGVLELLLLLASFSWDVVHHLPVVASLVLLGHVLKFALLLHRHSLETEFIISTGRTHNVQITPQ